MSCADCKNFEDYIFVQVTGKNRVLIGEKHRHVCIHSYPCLTPNSARKESSYFRLDDIFFYVIDEPLDAFSNGCPCFDPVE